MASPCSAPPARSGPRRCPHVPALSGRRGKMSPPPPRLNATNVVSTFPKVPRPARVPTTRKADRLCAASRPGRVNDAVQTSRPHRRTGGRHDDERRTRRRPGRKGAQHGCPPGRRSRGRGKVCAGSGQGAQETAREERDGGARHRCGRGCGAGPRLLRASRLPDGRMPPHLEPLDIDALRRDAGGACGSGVGRGSLVWGGTRSDRDRRQRPPGHTSRGADSRPDVRAHR